MAAIDITAMSGELPRVVAHMLPQSAAVFAQNCHFRHGVISPVKSDKKLDKVFSFTPGTIFNYRGDVWFAWNGIVNAIRSPVANDDYDRVYYTDGVYPKVTSSAIATQGSGNYPSASFRLGIPAPTTAISIGAITPPADHEEDDATDDETRFYIQTYVTAYGEEGPPSPVSAEATIVYPDSTVALTFDPPGTQNSNITRRRIYRSYTSDDTAEYLQVTELAIAVTSFLDNVAASALSATLETEDYFMPPAGMIGLCQMSNGICAGFMGNQVMFSEAYLPYAWKDSNKLTTKSDIVAIAPIGSSLVVGTKADPELFAGITPSNITNADPNVTLACVSRQSMVALDGFALYASPNGIVSVDASGNALVATQKIITPQQWRETFNPSTIRAWRLENEYFALYDTNGGVAGFIFSPENMDFRRITNEFDAGYKDEKSDTLYVAKGTRLYTLQDGVFPLSARWKSKPFLAQSDTSFSVLRIMSDQLFYVGLNLIVDGRVSVVLPPGSLAFGEQTQRIVKLPPLRGKKWQVEVWGKAQIDRITLATSLQELTP